MPTHHLFLSVCTCSLYETQNSVSVGYKILMESFYLFLFQAGIVEGIIVMILVAVISVKAMMMIVDCKYHIEDISNEIPSRKSKPNSSEVKLPKGDTGDLKAPLLEDTDAECSKDTVKKQLFEVLTYGDIGNYAVHIAHTQYRYCIYTVGL
jgi:hypothetical protein